MCSRILLANDGSLDARGALQPALALAHGLNANLAMLVVMTLPHSPLLKAEVDDAVQVAETRFSHIASIAQGRADAAHVPFYAEMALGNFIERTLAFIEEHRPDLLVVGQSGDSAFFEALFGNVAERLAWRAPCSVHLVKS